MIGWNIRNLREARDLSQRALAKPLGITYQQIQKYENGQNRISAAHLYNLSVILECSTEDFFRRDLEDIRHFEEISHSLTD